MEQVSEQLPEESMDGDIYTMVMFAIELGKLAEYEKIADMMFRINQKVEKMVTFMEAIDRRGLRR